MRHLLQSAGVIAGTGALGLALLNPVYAATTGYDEAIGVDPRMYASRTYFMTLRYPSLR